MPHPLTKNQPSHYLDKMTAIRLEAAPYIAKVEANDFDWRDVAILIEYLSQFGDVLDEMIENPPAIIPVLDSETVADKVIGLMYE